MAKTLKFTDYTAEYEDSDGDKHTSVVSAARVTADNKGREVNTRTGAVTLSAGNVVVATDNPNVFDVVTAEQWKSAGYEKNK